MVAFQRRFDPTFRRLQQSVEKGEIGDVHMIHITSRDPGPPPVAYIAQVREEKGGRDGRGGKGRGEEKGEGVGSFVYVCLVGWLVDLRWSCGLRVWCVCLWGRAREERTDGAFFVCA
jgi:hypothetical protein